MIKTAEDVYTAAASGDERAMLSLVLRSVLTGACAAYFDPVTWTVRPAELTGFVRGIAAETDDVIRDRIYSIAARCGQAVKSIMSLLRERIAREHLMQPVRDVREVDDASVRWLSRQTGRNLREKLAGKPYMLAVRRFMTYDNAENRLFKEMVKRLAKLLELRENALSSRAGSECAELLKMIRRWLRSDDAGTIGRWRNIPPTNTLLHDKRYRKIWDAWNDIERLDAFAVMDYEEVPQHLAEVLKWRQIAKMTREGYRLPQQLITVSFDDFTISAKLPVILGGPGKETVNVAEGKTFRITAGDDGVIIASVKGVAKLPLNESALEHYKQPAPDSHADEVAAPESAAVDLFTPRVKFSAGERVQTLPFRLALQFWGDRAAMCDDAPALFTGEGVKTITVNTIINDEELTDFQKDTAAARLIARLHESLRPSKEFAYIVPDYADDFALAPLRRAVNFRYGAAVPVPSSIAAAISFQSSDKFPKDLQAGSVMLVVEAAEKFISLTPVKAVRDELSDTLKKSVPATHGVTWERHPPVVIELEHSRGTDIAEAFGAALFDENGQLSTVSLSGQEWEHVENVSYPSVEVLKDERVISAINKLKGEHKDSRFTVIVASPNVSINAKDMPFPCRVFRASKLEGAFTLRKWQAQAGDVELWRDHLPELAMTSGGVKLWLVRNASILPRRGKVQRINVDAAFTLPAGQSSYMFRLQKGDGRERMKYAAFLRSSAFPLRADTVCRLELTYTYGADAPYELTFRPESDAAFRAVRAEWVPAGEVEPIDPKEAGLPCPAFPAAKSWIELQNYPKRDGSGTTDLLSWFTGAFSGLRRVFDYDPRIAAQRRAEKFSLNTRIAGIVDYIGRGSNGKLFIKVDTPSGRVTLFENSYCFIDIAEAGRLTLGCRVWLSVDCSRPANNRGEFSGVNASLADNAELLRRFINDAANNRPELDEDKTRKALHAARFPVYQLWNGHTLTDHNTPDDFRNNVRSICALCEKACDSPEVPDDVKSEILYLMCCMGSDAPSFAVKWLLQHTQTPDDINTHHNHIAYAIGNVSQAWQKDLLRKIVSLPVKEGRTPPPNIEPQKKGLFSKLMDKLKSSAPQPEKQPEPAKLPRHVTLSVLALAVWRSEKLIYSLTPEEWQHVAEILCSRLDEERKKLIKIDTKHYNPYTLCRMLELTLALLRSRDDQRKEVRMLLAPNTELAEKFSDLVEAIAAAVIKRRVELKSFVEIEIPDKPDTFREWLDILYTLHAYFDSEGTSAGSIKITGFAETD